MAGVSDPVTAIWLSAGVAAINFLCTFIGLFLVERMGRRKLFLSSICGVVVALLVLAAGFQLADMDTPSVTLNTTDPAEGCGLHPDCSSCTYDAQCGFCYVVPEAGSGLLAINGSCVPVSPDSSEQAAQGRCAEAKTTSNNGGDDLNFAPDYCPSQYAWVVIAGLCLYLLTFAPGVGPLPWTINSEIYPSWARSTCQSLATSTNWASNLIVSMTFLSLTEVITKQGTFYMYTGIASLGAILFYFILPETKGKSLEDMEQLFSGA